MPEAVWVEAGQTGRLERVLEDSADRAGIAPVLAGEPGGLELAVRALLDQRSREERVVAAPVSIGVGLGPLIGIQKGPL